MWVEILTTAFVLQLAALPGEKGQFVIAGLATAYRPAVVVAGAACAFGGWTVLEIWLGSALQGALPAVYLDGATAALFVVFAGWLVYSTPGAGEAGWHDRLAASGGPRLPWFVPEQLAGRFGGFVPAVLLMAVGEFGDKTQLITIGLAAQYGAHPAIWVGEMLAIVPVSAANAVLFHRFADRVDLAWAHRVAAALFLAFAADITAGYALGVSLLPFG